MALINVRKSLQPWTRFRARTRWMIAIGYFVVFSTFLLLPHPERLLEGISGRKKSSWLDVDTEKAISYAVHFSGFAVMVMAFLWASGQHGTAAYRYLATAAAVYGVVIEFIQQQVPNRSFEWFDILANAAGCATGALLTSRLINRDRPEHAK